MPINKFLEETITFSKRENGHVKGTFTVDSILNGFEIESHDNGSSYTFSSPRKIGQNGNIKEPALTFDIKCGSKAIGEDEVISALIDKVTTANAEYILSKTGRQMNTINKQPLAYIKEIGTENLSKQLLEVPTLINLISEYADQIIENTINKVNDQRNEKLVNLIRKHKNEPNFNKSAFTKNFNELVTTTTEQYLDAYLFKAKPIYLNNVEKDEHSYAKFAHENQFGPNNRDIGDRD